jgi:hypothetical protein
MIHDFSLDNPQILWNSASTPLLTFVGPTRVELELELRDLRWQVVSQCVRILGVKEKTG